MRKIIIYMAFFIPVMLFAQDKKEEEISFDATKDYINKKIKAFSLEIDKDDKIKVDSVAIEKSGVVKIIYKDNKAEPVTFYIGNLFKTRFSNDEGGCNCGITLNKGLITFWIKKDEGIAIKIQDSEAKSVYKAFVNLIKVTKGEDLFAD